MDKSFHYFLGIWIIMSYVVPVLLSKEPLNRILFRKYFGLSFLIVFILAFLLYIVPKGSGQYYIETLIILLVAVFGAIFYISARRYLDIGGSRWNVFVCFFHFTDFLRLWWEDPKPEAAAAGANPAQQPDRKDGP